MKLLYRYIILVITRAVIHCDTVCTSATPQIMNGQYIRRPLIRAVYNRMMEDQKHLHDSHESWYRVDLSKLPELCDRFVQSHQDEETTEFLEICMDKADRIMTQIYHSIAKSMLCWFMTNTSINGLLGRGSMFVFSAAQFEKLLEISPLWKGNSLLDLGAGDGTVTAKMSNHFEETFVTEMSKPMIWKLKERAYNILGIDEWAEEEKYDVVSCLNVIDRCEKPMSMLRNIRKSLRKGTGRAVISVVLPFKPYVEFDTADHLPTEVLLVNGDSFEEQVASFTEHVFKNAGLQVVKFTRLPYLCEGDNSKSFYVLTDAVFVLKPA